MIWVDSKPLNKIKIPDELVREMRSSIILMGAMLSRCGEVIISYPGGCEIGPRPIDMHLKALREMGAEIEESHGFLHCKTKKLRGCEIQLDYPSVGATENIILAAVKAQGTTIIRNAAREPEIIDLQNYLNKAGAKVSGAGTSIVIVEGVDKLGDVTHNTMPRGPPSDYNRVHPPNQNSGKIDYSVICPTTYFAKKELMLSRPV
jgi:UDP-N-acetylglucosamine 1-carboxyvinyltransferase